MTDLNESPAMQIHDTAILSIRDLSVAFTVGIGRHKSRMVAVNKVSLTVERGQIRALVGESGSGKSTVARSICGLQKEYSGEILFDGVKLAPRRSREQWRQIQMVFQDPYASLDPRMNVGETLRELLKFHKVVPQSQVAARCNELMELVQLPKSMLRSRPGSMSGGQRQRVAIARALSLNPRLLIADEAVAALDVSVQAGIVNLLGDLRNGLDLSILFIAHDLAVVRNLCDDVSVIYRGDIVEEAPRTELFSNPDNAYTQQLLSAVPRLQSAFLDSQ